MPERCCVFQPFDNGGPYDKRYVDVIEPAVKTALLEPYRVDQDPAATVPIEALEEEIRRASACIADISGDNPNVWYELGYASASKTPVVMICSKARTPLPFDIGHRKIVFYASDSTRDFEELKKNIGDRLVAELKKKATVTDIISASPIASTQGLRPHEISVLAFIMANRSSTQDGVGAYIVKRDMREAGFTELAAGLALTKLEHMEFIVGRELQDSQGNESYIAYFLTHSGEAWLLDNQHTLDIKL
jgi:hypothetical protein